MWWLMETGFKDREQKDGSLLQKFFIEKVILIVDVPNGFVNHACQPNAAAIFDGRFFQKDM